MNLSDFREDSVMNQKYPEPLLNFITYLETMKGSSKNTISSYVLDIMILLKFLKVKKALVPEDMPFSEINVHDIDNNFLDKITLDDMYSFLIFSKKYLENGSSTIVRKVQSMRAFFKYLHLKVKVISHDYTDELDKPKIGTRKPKYMNLDEATTLLNSKSASNLIFLKLIPSSRSNISSLVFIRYELPELPVAITLIILITSFIKGGISPLCYLEWFITF